MPLEPPPFEVCFDKCVSTMYPSDGEAVVVDDAGRIWMPESGSAPGEGALPNHARVVMYDPPNALVRLYNRPGDQNGPLGVAWDAARGRIWLSQTNSLAYGPGGSLLSFDPERLQRPGHCSSTRAAIRSGRIATATSCSSFAPTERASGSSRTRAAS